MILSPNLIPVYLLNLATYIIHFTTYEIIHFLKKIKLRFDIVNNPKILWGHYLLIKNKNNEKSIFKNACLGSHLFTFKFL